MGTNYYAVDRPPCPTCDRPFERRHIGKSSAGWCFALHGYLEEEIHGLSDWLHVLTRPGTIIVNESDEQITLEALVETICGRHGEHTTAVSTLTPDWLQTNHATFGPYGLARVHPSTASFVSHGLGTWDCLEGEFS